MRIQSNNEFNYLYGKGWLAIMLAGLLLLGGCGDSTTTTPPAPVPVAPTTLSVTSASVIEGNAGLSSLNFTVTLNAVSATAVSVDYATTNGTALNTGDYSPTSGTLSIPAGATSGTILVPVIGETLVEPDETFTLTLSNPLNASIVTAVATGTIINDDFPTVSVANVSVGEGSTAGTTNLNFTLTLSAATNAVSVDYATSDGTALAASDYTATNATVTIAAGATTAIVTVLVNADTLFEPNETLTLTLSNPGNATITTASATGTITNDDWVYNSPAGIAMINAGFVYVPGGWDVNGDGVIESGFWLSKYEASATATPAVIKANVIDYLAGTAANAYADGMQVYNPTTKQFDQTLCVNGTDITPGVTPAGCRHNSYFKFGNAVIAVNRVQFVNNALPLVNESAVEAMAAVADSPIVGGVAISLPSEVQWMQVVQLLVNNPASWSNGVVNVGGTLWRGNSNGVGALAANNLGATDTTENATFDVNRRTWLLTNGVMANDSAVPATYCQATNADASANGSLESVDAATEAVCTVWDVAGNVWQWTRGMVAANAATSSTGARLGGDRFINGVSGVQQYSNVTLQANAPAWWIPKLAGGTVLTATQNVGIYWDGDSQAGASDNVNLGYAVGSVSGFAAVVRGGRWGGGAVAGLAAADLVVGPGFRISIVGFRAAAL